MKYFQNAHLVEDFVRLMFYKIQMALGLGLRVIKQTNACFSFGQSILTYRHSIYLHIDCSTVYLCFIHFYILVQYFLSSTLWNFQKPGMHANINTGRDLQDRENYFIYEDLIQMKIYIFKKETILSKANLSDTVYVFNQLLTKRGKHPVTLQHFNAFMHRHGEDSLLKFQQNKLKASEKVRRFVWDFSDVKKLLVRERLVCTIQKQ